MLTVPEAAKRVGRDLETIRCWIRSGRLVARKIGTQHIVDEADLLNVIADDQGALPAAWRVTASGKPMPNMVAALRRSRSVR